MNDTGSPRLAVVDVVGLTRRHLEGGRMPRLAAFAGRTGVSAFAETFPALTCSAQSTFVTGQGPGSHGVVGNGWYHRELCEVQFWKQPDNIVQGRKIWHRLREARPGATTAKVFWWYNMYSEVEFALTPRPMYPADGRKVFDIHTTPADLRFEIQRPDQLGPFPFRAFWGPGSGIAGSRWIARAARWVEERHAPTLNLVYLPHLDYPLQKLGPAHPSLPAELAAIDTVAGELVEFLEARGVGVVVVSEYGIVPVTSPIYLNRVLRANGWLAVKDELGRDMLDAGASRAFAVADHQVAHVYVNDPRILPAVRETVAALPGVATVHGPAELGWAPGSVAALRAGDLVAVAAADAWFAYPYWDDDARAPDFARTVDIHRKPGYDPCELFIDPALRWPPLKVAGFLLRKKLGLRALLEVVPLDASLVRGSHGRPADDPLDRPVFLGAGAATVRADTDVQAALLAGLGVGRQT